MRILCLWRYVQGASLILVHPPPMNFSIDITNKFKLGCPKLPISDRHGIVVKNKNGSLQGRLTAGDRQIKTVGGVGLCDNQQRLQANHLHLQPRRSKDTPLARVRKCPDSRRRPQLYPPMCPTSRTSRRSNPTAA